MSPLPLRLPLRLPRCWNHRNMQRRALPLFFLSKVQLSLLPSMLRMLCRTSRALCIVQTLWKTK